MAVPGVTKEIRDKIQASTQSSGLYYDILNHSGITNDCFFFCSAFCVYTNRGPGAKSTRLCGWNALDNNGNGHVSLAETGKWIQDTLIDYIITLQKSGVLDSGINAKDAGVALYKHFYPVYIRAFLDAADYGENKKVKGTKTATEDDYVQFNEFRLLCNYLVIYAIWQDEFAKIDGKGEGQTKDDDRRISKDEWSTYCKGKNTSAHPMDSVSMAIKGGEKEFTRMDADGKGMVLLKEYCEYLEAIESKHLKSKIGRLLAAGEGDEK